jgi:glutamine amidotransferase
VRIVVFDYGAGNLHSLRKAIAGQGREIRVEPDPSRLLAGDVLVLPGVGAFATAVARLAPVRAEIADALRAGHPCLGICLGTQLLFGSSEEGAGVGLAVIRGRVTRLEADRVPHIGWNDVSGPEPLLREAGLSLGYFAHGYACRPMDAGCVTAWTHHQNDCFPAVLRTARTIGFQFHPEKSALPGIRLLHAALGAVFAEAL